MHLYILHPLFAAVGNQNGVSSVLLILGEILALVLFILAFGWVIQLYRYTRGGQSAKAWGLLSGGLFLLALRLLFEFTSLAVIFDVGPELETSITFFAALLLAIGFRNQKKILR